MPRRTLAPLRRRRWLLAYVLALPALFWLGGFVFYPTLRAVWDGFTSLHLLRPGETEWVGLANYRRLWSDPLFWLSFKHSALLTALAVPLEFVLGLLLALGLKQPLPGMRLFRALVLVGWVTSIVAQVALFQWLFDPAHGPVAQALRALGLGGWVRNWFNDPDTAFGMIVLLHVWRNAPFFALGFLTAMLAVPRELYEAARLDGAAAWARLRHVTLPQLRWIASALVLSHVAFTFTDYTMVAVATGGGPLHATEVVSTYLYKQAWSGHELGLASATGTVMLATLSLFSALYVRQQWREAA